MIRIQIDVDLHDTQEHLEAMSLRSHDFAPVFEEGRILLEAANAENFGSGGLPVGGWQPRRDMYPWPLMVKTGKLAGSLTNLSGPPNRIGPMSAEFGTDVDYAHFHQAGTRKMASRKIVYEPVGFAAELAKKAENHIVFGTLGIF